MMEVMEEAELDAIQRRQMEFEQMRNAELVEVQRLDAEASRRFAEKQRRFTQETDRLRQQAELGQKVAARAFARSYLANLSELAFDQLEDSGHFVDPVEKEIQDSFIPWLFDSVVETTNNHISSSSCVDALLGTNWRQVADDSNSRSYSLPSFIASVLPVKSQTTSELTIPRRCFQLLYG